MSARPLFFVIISFYRKIIIKRDAFKVRMSTSLLECYDEDTQTATRTQCRLLQQQHGDIDCVVNPRWENYNARTVAEAMREDEDICIIVKRSIGTLEERMLIEKAKADIVAASPPQAPESVFYYDIYL